MKRYILTLALLSLALAACGGAPPAPATSCDVADDGSGVSGSFTCGGDNLFWKWTGDDGASHVCDQAPCPVGALCDLHAHLGVCHEVAP